MKFISLDIMEKMEKTTVYVNGKNGKIYFDIPKEQAMKIAGLQKWFKTKKDGKKKDK